MNNKSILNTGFGVIDIFSFSSALSQLDVYGGGGKAVDVSAGHF